MYLRKLNNKILKFIYNIKLNLQYLLEYEKDNIRKNCLLFISIIYIFSKYFLYYHNSNLIEFNQKEENFILILKFNGLKFIKIVEASCTVNLISEQVSLKTSQNITEMDKLYGCKNNQYHKYFKEEILEAIDKNLSRLSKVDNIFEYNKLLREMPLPNGISLLLRQLNADIFEIETDEGKVLILKRIPYWNPIEITEGQLVLELDHRNIVKTYDSFIKENKKSSKKKETEVKICWILMEYCGESVNCHNFDIDEEFIKKLNEDISQALEYLHKNNYMHGDIHCGNIMGVRNEKGINTFKLIDFGKSRKVMSQKQKNEDIESLKRVIYDLKDRSKDDN